MPTRRLIPNAYRRASRGFFLSSRLTRRGFSRLFTSKARNPYFTDKDLSALAAKLGIENDYVYKAYFFNLARLDLADVHAGNWPDPGDERSFVTVPHFVRATALGYAFFAACTAPTGAQAGAQGG